MVGCRTSCSIRTPRTISGSRPLGDRGAHGRRTARATHQWTGSAAGPRAGARAHREVGNGCDSRASRGAAAQRRGLAPLPGDGARSRRQRTAEHLSPLGSGYRQLATLGRRAGATRGRRPVAVSATRPEARGRSVRATDPGRVRPLSVAGRSAQETGATTTRRSSADHPFLIKDVLMSAIFAAASVRRWPARRGQRRGRRVGPSRRARGRTGARNAEGWRSTGTCARTRRSTSERARGSRRSCCRAFRRAARPDVRAGCEARDSRARTAWRSRSCRARRRARPASSSARTGAVRAGRS